MQSSSLRPWLSLCMALLASMLLQACALNPPVQEMSNARQAIQAARDVQAEVHAPNLLSEAEAMLLQATRALEGGDYLAAREHAIAAQQQAIKARQQAMYKQRK